MEYVFAYGAGLLTLINPCVVPVLPIVIASALQSGRWGPVMMALGLSLSFVTLGVTVTAFGHLIGLDQITLTRAGAVLMILFGAVLLLPQGSALMTSATAGLSTRADARIDTLDRQSTRGQFLGGLLLGAVWSPCIGPTLGSAIGLASTGESLLHATAIMMFFAAGVSTLILGLAYGTRGAIGRHNQKLRNIAQNARPILGATFLLVGIGLLLEWHHVLEAWLIGIMPAWLIDLSVSL